VPTIRVNGARLHYEDTGGAGAPVVFAHGLLFSGRMFDAQVAALKGRYRCVAYDARGHGQSEATRGGYDMDTAFADAAALIEALGAAPCHFVGLSMGGFVGMRLAARRPELLRTLTLLATSADPEPGEHVRPYKRMAFVARWLGMRLVAARVMRILFGPKFLTDPGRAAERQEWRRRLLANSKAGVTRGTLGIVHRQPIAEELKNVRTPTLVLVGSEDVATVPAKARRIHQLIAGSRLVVIPDAGHSPTVEEPAVVNAALADFLAAHQSSTEPSSSS
jgi:pimeloyl-ACP methyl ester carboxylesterase